MAKIGSKQNASLNGEWGKHVNKRQKKRTAKIRRAIDKKIKKLFLICLEE